LIKNQGIQVTLFERRLVPFGLVRYGVAPDHSDVKNAISKFEMISKHPQVQFVGGCYVGQDISVKELQKNYDAVVLSQGSILDRQLGIPNEDLIKNVFSARNFVGWYNGDPEIDILPDLESNDTAVIIGQGNVALDCARILLAPIDHLAKTDISERALELLRKSRIKHVHVVGRRGPLEAAFTSKEVRELMALPDVGFHTDSIMKTEIANNSEMIAKNRAKKRLTDILLKGSKNTTFSKTWNLTFLKSPMKFRVDSDWNIQGIELEKNRLENGRAIGTGETEILNCGLLIKSVGYLNQAIPGVPFDEKKHVIPNMGGKVIDAVLCIN
jgi:adrenodoxin-NADP+ reductase